MKKILLTSISLLMIVGISVAQDGKAKKTVSKRVPKTEQKAEEARRVAEKQAHYKTLQAQSTKPAKAN